MLFLAYKGFERFLKGPLTWENYKREVIDPYPVMRNYHLIFSAFLGGIEGLKALVSTISPERYLEVLSRVKEEELLEMHESVMARCEEVVQPELEVDIYLILSPFMPSSMSVPASGKMNVVASVAYGEKLPLVLSHEYAHCIFVPKMSESGLVERFTEDLSDEEFYELISKLWFDRPLKWGMVNEGFASFFTKFVFPECSMYEALWMMPREAVDWCARNERKLKEEISRNLEERGREAMRKYFMTGPLSSPPEGFPGQTAYYAGYRIVESCLKRISLKEFFSLGIDEIVSASGYFK